MMRLAAVLVALAAGLSACEPDPAPTPADPIVGTWKIHRTAHVTAGTACPTLDLGDFTLAVTPGHLELEDNHLWDGNPPELGPTHVWFETDELAFVENDNPVIIGHDLDVVGDQLVGTGGAAGDGPYIDCQWELDVVGTRQP